MEIKKTIGIKKIIWLTVGILFAVFWILPILWLILIPFKPRGFLVSAIDKIFTSGWTLNNILRLLTETHFKKWILNSVTISIIQTIIVIFLASFTAYTFSQMKFRGKKILYGMLFVAFMLPGEAMLIPLFKLVAIDFKLSNSFVGVVLPGLTNIFAFVVIKNFYDAIPKDFKESAQIEGAGYFRLWLKIYLPMGMGIAVTMGILSFIGSWNSFTWPMLLITSPDKYTLPIALPQFQGAYTAIDLALPMAANLLATLPVLIFFLIFQKQIMEVQIEGGIK